MTSKSSSPLFQFASDSDHNMVEAFPSDVKRDALKSARPDSKKSGACVDCKSVKVRCEPVPGERKCRRCQTKNLPCRPRDRKKRKAADTHEELQEKAHSQDLQIQQLLMQYDRLKADQKIRHWVSRSHPGQSSLRPYDRTADYYKWLQAGTSPEDASIIYFGLDRRVQVPEIVKHCGLYPEEIVQLFTLFFKHVNPHFSILDEALHTPQDLIANSSFLFTVVCAVASRHYVARPEVYPLAMDFARDAAGKGLVEGQQSVDTCQAYLLLSVYPIPTKKWVEDRSWLLMGVAIRMAMELKLNQPPPPELSERERLNQVRTWLNCYCVDGSHAIQFGKMPMLRLDDFLARSSTHWYRSSSMNTPLDVHLVAYVQILLIMAKWRAIVTEQSKDEHTKDSEVVDTALKTHALLSTEMDRWVKVYTEELSYNPLAVCHYRGNTTQMIIAYLKLVVLTHAFCTAYRSQGLSPECEMLRYPLDAARSVIQIMVERLAPTGHLRSAMGANFLYVSYAAAFLINLLRPKLAPLLIDTEKKEIVLTVTHLINVLGSPEVSLDEKHTPALYSRFLSTLLRQHCPASLLEACGTPPISEGETPEGSEERDDVSTTYYPSWPDVSGLPVAGPSRMPDAGSMAGMVYQQHGDPHMDFSLNHFVRTIRGQAPRSGGGTVRYATSDAWRSWPEEQLFAQPDLHSMPLTGIWRD